MALPAARRVFSGIQPTGVPHLGNYLGAIVNWVRLQDHGLDSVTAGGGGGTAAPTAPASTSAAAAAAAPRAAAPPRDDVVFCVVDLHAMTQPYDPRALHAACRLTAASLIACGIDPRRSVLFRQSAVRAHTELAWLLGCVTPLGALRRMTQFKDKAARGGGGGRGGGGDDAGLGLLSYPVLQAADILLYRATHVPVGADQAQHLELAREVAAGFNRRFGGAPGGAGDGGGWSSSAGGGGVCDDGGPPAALPHPLPAALFPLPATVTLGGPGGAGCGRVMSLRDGSRKMSKSDPDDGSRVNLTDSADAIADKVRRARTDSVTGFSWDPERRPDKSNLLGIMAALGGGGGGGDVHALAARYAATSAADFKRDLTDVLVAAVTPIGARIRELLADGGGGGGVAGGGGEGGGGGGGGLVDDALREGAQRAEALAADTMARVRLATGYR